MKNCAKCGHENTDDAVFCASCGSPIEQAPAAVEAPAAPVSAPEPAAAPAYDAYAAPAAAAAPTQSNKATLWLILNIVITVICCPFSFVFSVIGIIFAAIGMGSYKKGDYEDMNKKAKIAMIMFIIGIGLALLLWILSFIGMFSIPFIDGFTRGFESSYYN